jgi:hypothetical protein
MEESFYASLKEIQNKVSHLIKHIETYGASSIEEEKKQRKILGKEIIFKLLDE